MHHFIQVCFLTLDGSEVEELTNGLATPSVTVRSRAALSSSVSHPGHTFSFFLCYPQKSYQRWATTVQSTDTLTLSVAGTRLRTHTQ